MTRTNEPRLVLCELRETTDGELETYSPFCLKVRRALLYAGLPFESRRATTPAGHRDVNPAGQVPVLLVDDQPIADSTAILAHIERLRPTERSAEARAESLLFEELADTALNGFVVASRWADDRNWPRVRDAFFAGAPWFVRALIAPRIRAGVVRSLVARDVWRAGPDACWARFVSLLDQLEVRAPETGFWVEGEPSAADWALFGQLQSLRCALTPWQREAIEARPRLTRYLDRVDALAGRAGHSAAAGSPSESSSSSKNRTSIAGSGTKCASVETPSRTLPA